MECRERGAGVGDAWPRFRPANQVRETQGGAGVGMNGQNSGQPIMCAWGWYGV